MEGERAAYSLGARIMTKFQYRFELSTGKSFSHAEEDRVEEELNEVGNQGWELVAVSPCGTENAYLGYWFKRPIEAN